MIVTSPVFLYTYTYSVKQIVNEDDFLLISWQVKFKYWILTWSPLLITSLAGAVAKYCDEYVCVYVCLSVCLCPRAYLQNYAYDLYQFFCVCCLWPWLSPPVGLQNPKGKAAIWGLPGPFKAFAILAAAGAATFSAKGIIQLPITSCSRRDHSVCQTTANRNPENFERRRCNVSAGKEVLAVHNVGEVWYLRLPCYGRPMEYGRPLYFCPVVSSFFLLFPCIILAVED